MIVALVVGTLLAVGALAFVLYPLFFDVAPPVSSRLAPRHVTARDRDAATQVARKRDGDGEGEGEGDTAITALREIEFDRATGKLSDADYAHLKARYTQQAVLAMRRRAPSAPVAAPSDEEIEAAVAAYRARARDGACPECGPRPEPDALYCSTCGRYLRDRCADCGAPVEALEARYCVNCGSRLAA